MGPQNQSGSAFPKENSLALKGIAILMMMWHHCFLAGRFEKYAVNFWPLKQSQVVNIADFCKICVSFFVFVSGYGLYLTWKKAKEKRQPTSRWCYEKLIRTLSGYWFVVILAWIVCTFLDNRVYQVYGFDQSVFSGIWHMLVEFLGLSNITGEASLNSTWWYMSAAIVFIIFFPLINAGFEQVGCFCTLGLILIFPRISMGFPGWVHFYSFLPIFCIGMIFARYDFFAVWNKIWEDKTSRIRKLKFFLMLCGLFAVYKLFYHMNVNVWWDMKWNIFPVFVIVFSYDYLFKIPALSKLLQFVGLHATNIFLVHTFIRYYYCEAFIYGKKHFILIMGTLLLVSIAVSIIVEQIKKILHYDMWIQRLLRVPEKLNVKWHFN